MVQEIKVHQKKCFLGTWIHGQVKVGRSGKQKKKVKVGHSEKKKRKVKVGHTNKWNRDILFFIIPNQWKFPSNVIRKHSNRIGHRQTANSFSMDHLPLSDPSPPRSNKVTSTSTVTNPHVLPKPMYLLHTQAFPM